MGNVVEDIISLHGGMSQQDISLRLPHQVEDSINCYHTVAEGTRKRNPTELVKANTVIQGKSFTYSYNRGLVGSDNEKYTLIYNVDGLFVMDLNDGSVEEVNGSTTYLDKYPTGGFSKTGYAAMTIKDTTFITNRNVECKTKGTATPTVNNVGYIWVSRAEPVDGYTYIVTCNGITHTISGEKTTSAVATAIAGKYSNATAKGNIVRFTSCSSLNVSDSYGDQASSVFFNSVESENDLPKSVSSGFEPIKIEVVGTNNYASTYWLEYSGGSWSESTGEGVITELDASTMPHKIVRETDGSFTISEVEWEDRLIGDDDNCAEPSFVGSSIVDIFFFKNRLGMLTPNSLLTSETAEHFNFWRTTQVAVLDSDRIDVDIESQQAIRLHYVAFLEDDIVIFGDKSQFRVSHDGILSINTISATMITEYDFNSSVRPLSIDSHVYFLARNGEYNALYVYNTEGVTSVSRANPVTGHVPQFLDNQISSMVGSSVNSVLFFATEDNPNLLYVYKYLYDGDKLLQSAWFKWEFTGEVSEAFTTESELHLLISRDSGITEDLSVTYNGVWNDDKVWLNEMLWNDDSSLDTYNLETIQLVPNKVDTKYLDNGDITYSSLCKLSEYLPRNAEKTILSAKVQMRTISLKADKDSGFALKIENTNRNKERIVTEEYVLNRKPYIMGKAKDVSISVLGRDDAGFRIDGYSIESNVTQRSQQI